MTRFELSTISMVDRRIAEKSKFVPSAKPYFFSGETKELFYYTFKR